MLKNKKNIIIGIIALVLVVGVISVKAADRIASVTINNVENLTMNVEGYTEDMGDMIGASGTRFPNGISADRTSPSAGEVRGTTLTTTGAVTIGGAATLSSTLAVDGITTLGGGVLATSTSASAGTLTESDLLTYNYFKVTANTPGGFALTLPATSTMTTLIPNAGDFVDIYIENATSSTQALTITTGTGIRLVATDTNQDVIDATEVSWIRLIRENDTDVLGIMSNELVDAD